jgi:hypothetical protein
MKKLKLTSPLRLNKETVAQLTQLQNPSVNKMITGGTLDRVCFSCGGSWSVCD